MKHTPGPWEIFEDSGEIYSGKFELGGNGSFLATTYGCGGEYSLLGAEEQEECQANARLIAAAPDLLASGKARIEALEALLACYRLGKRATEKLLTQLEQSKKGWEAAIKKAEEED